MRAIEKEAYQRVGGNIVIRSFQKLIVGFNKISTA